MSIKEEIKKVVERHFPHISNIEIATLKMGLVAVWVNGHRFGNYNVNQHRFVELVEYQ